MSRGKSYVGLGKVSLLNVLVVSAAVIAVQGVKTLFIPTSLTMEIVQRIAAYSLLIPAFAFSIANALHWARRDIQARERLLQTVIRERRVTDSELLDELRMSVAARLERERAT
jgi:hypothetical protein